MMTILNKVMDSALEQLAAYVSNYVPSLLAAGVLFLAAWLFAILVRWLVYRIFKGLTIDRFLRQSGLAHMIDRSGRLRATRIVAESLYWGILLSGALLGLSVFNTNLTSQMIDGFVVLLPKLVVAGIILLAGVWLSQYLGRGTLVWAVNDGLPSPRRLAAAVRILILLVAVAAAADQLNFARSVFLAGFILVVGGVVLAASLAVGIGASGGVRRYLAEKQQPREEDERSLWSHL